MNSIAVSISIAAHHYQRSVGHWPGCVLLGPEQHDQLSKELFANWDPTEDTAKFIDETITMLWDMEIFQIKEVQDLSITLGGKIERHPL